MHRCRVNFQCRGVLLICKIVGQGPTMLSVGTGRVVWTFFSLVFTWSCCVWQNIYFHSLALSFLTWSYCTWQNIPVHSLAFSLFTWSCCTWQNSPAYSFAFSLFTWSCGGGRVVRWCWVNFQCRGVLQF